MANSLIVVRLMAYWNIQVAYGRFGTIPDTLLAALACLCMINMGMAVREYNDLTKYMVGTSIHTSPTALALVGVNFNKFRA
jgi:hypothetical protein